VSLLEAYGATHYRVCDGVQNFTLQIGKYSQELADLFRQSNTVSALFITADNPFSEAVSEAENAANHRILGEHLRCLVVAVHEGAGQDAQGQWPAEGSYLALGISLPQASALGIEYRQNAVVWIDEDAIPQLILLR
jgi:hypothetical protein